MGKTGKKKMPAAVPEDIVAEAKKKSKFFAEYYASLQNIQEKLSLDEIDIMAKALEVATLQAKQREEDEKRARRAAAEQRRRAARQQKEAREKLRAAAVRAQIEAEQHEAHVKSVTCMDLPADFENAYADDVPDVCADSAADGLVLCLDRLGRVDIEYIARLTGLSLREIILSLHRSIYQNPLVWGECFYKGWETSDEYLSGNLLYKLSAAKEANETYNGYFQSNVDALTALLPPAVDAENIYITLGSPWVPPDVIDDFILHLVGLVRTNHDAQAWKQEDYKTRHDEFTGIWEIPEKNRFKNSALHGRYEQTCCSVYGTERMGMMEILENALNQRSVQVTDSVDTGKIDPATGKHILRRAINNDETVKALEKQEKLVKEFQHWVWEDDARRQRLQGDYASRFGGVRKRVFNGSFLRFPGMAENIRLYDYQKDAVARILFTPNTLLAHDVGTGKTFIMIAAGMELRRLGKSKKNLYVVPNNILGQWKNAFFKLYPAARLLVVDKKNFCPQKRAGTLQMIRDGDYDAILMAYSSFDRLSLSRNYYICQYQRHLEILEKAKTGFASKGRIDAKIMRIERAIEKLKTEIPKNVCVIPFDELGINTMFLDEEHYYKNVPIETAIHRVHGINRSGSDKCEAMMDKVHCIQRQNNGGRVIFATGTPITNSLTDIYVLQKYLQDGELEFAGIQNFDSWVGMFAEKTTEYEIDVDTNSYHLKTRFSRFKNIPELTAMLSSVADFHRDESTKNSPEFAGYTDSVAQGSELFRDYLKAISDRVDDIRNGRVDTKTDNMLKITSDGRKAALDIRLIDQVFGRETDSKIMRCAENVADIYFETRETRGVQLVFCDISTPKDGFNLYDELRQLLIAMGIPGHKIAFIHEANSDSERETLFGQLRSGDKSVIIGSTFKTGHGVNIQERLVALHHLDVPWRPADMVQREGRILRRGNTSKCVRIFRYITTGSFDAYSWQLLEAKQRFISQILAGDCTQRESSDVDETVLNYAEVKALALGNPQIKRRVELANELSKYQILEREQIAKRAKQQRELGALPQKLEGQERRIALCAQDIAETDLLIAQENQRRAAQKAARAARLAAVDAKNILREKAEAAEKAWKNADKKALAAERLAEGDPRQREDAEIQRKKADALLAVSRQLTAELERAMEDLRGARALAAEEADDPEAARLLRRSIFKAAAANVNRTADTPVAEYRGFQVLIPAGMIPHAAGEKKEPDEPAAGGGREYGVCLVRHARYYIDIGDELGILRRFDNFINGLRGYRAKLESALQDSRTRGEALRKELDSKESYAAEIDRLQRELDRLDRELGLKEAS